jgi:hypothetical protein
VKANNDRAMKNEGFGEAGLSQPQLSDSREGRVWD